MSHVALRRLVFLVATLGFLGFACGFQILQEGNQAGDWHGMFFLNANTGFLVGDNARILRTDDGGQNWSSLRSGISKKVRLKGVWFFDELNGLVCGELGTLYSTADGGRTWKRISVGGAELDGIAFAGRVGYVVGLSGRVLVTEDRGASWTESERKTKRLLMAVDCAGEHHAWAVGLGGTILHTADGGANWEFQESGTASILLDVCFVDEKRGWAVGTDGVIIHTSNGGITWRPQQSGARHELNGVCFVDAKTGYIVGQESIYLHTTDGGHTWQKEILIDKNEWLYSVFMLEADKGFACGKKGILISIP
ncbi:MAG: hypothetical protein JW941_03205 [Candidatus Coatesbacteria bacterium]|nr:hypothetical protein [Candidatus Coatesbacteria bacterium]